MKNMLVKWIGLLAIVGWAGTTQAGIIFTSTGGSSTSGQDFTYGFDFTPVVNITVDSLGFYDAGLDGLNSSHQVGIWTTGGALLTSTAVTTANSILSGAVFNNGQFRFTQISALNLLAGTTYRFAAAIEQASDIWYFGGTNIAASPSLATVSSTGFFTSGNFLFPGQTIGNTYAAGSFTASATRQVPAPATLALFGLGLAGLGWSRRKKA